MKGLRHLCFLALLTSGICAHGQTLSSTYSDHGVGILNSQGLPHNMAMGEVGLAVTSNWYLNHQNPAFLPFNRFSVFQVGMEMDRRSMSSNNFNDSKVSGGLRFLNYAFPVKSGVWTTSFGLSPFSSTGLAKFSQEELGAETIITEFVNSGGLSSFHVSNGFKVAENFYAGWRTTFLFGSVDYTETKALRDLESFSSEFTESSSYAGTRHDFSLGYIRKIGEKKDLNLGLVYTPQQDLNGTVDRSLRSELTEVVSTLEEKISFKLPQTIGFGVSYQNGNEWVVASDFSTAKWSGAGDNDDEFVNTTKFGIGAQWTPDLSNVNNYWKRVSYRFGVNVENLPYRVNGQEINEVGINFGGSFPVGVSSMDLAFKYGRLGTLDQDLVRETYFRIVIGATINDRWFIKRRYD